MRNQYRETAIGGAPAMPSGNGKALSPLTCRCADCQFHGGLSVAIEHFNTTGHRLTYKGIVQDFSHLRRLDTSRQQEQ